MVYCYEPQLLEPVTLYAVVHYVAQAVEGTAALQFLFGFLYGGGYAKAEARVVVYLYS